MKTISLSILFLSALAVQAEDVFSETWFTYEMGRSTKKKFTVKEDKLHTATLSYWDENAEWENARVYPIVHRNKDVLIYDDTKGWFYAIALVPVEAKTHKVSHQKVSSSAKLDEVKKVAAVWKPDPIDVLYSVPAFREAEVEKLEKLRPFHKITREDLLTLLDKQQAHEGILDAFAKENPGLPPFRMFRFVRNLLFKDVLEMGYNPYATYEGDPLAAFKDDEEIQKRLEALLK